MGTQITQVAGNPTSWKLTVKGREVACASARSMGASGGIYWFNVAQDVMTRDDAVELFRAHFKGDGICRFASKDDGECLNFESSYFGWLCATCGLYTARTLVQPEVLPQKNTEETKGVL